MGKTETRTRAKTDRRGGFVGGGYDCYRTRLVLTPYGYRYRAINICAF